MAPIVLSTDVHCYDCARRIRDTIKNLLGVEEVWASPETGLVYVAGTADATVLRRRIKHRMRRSVAIVSDGVDGARLPDYYYGVMPRLAPEGEPQYYYWATTTTPRHRRPYSRLPPSPPLCCAYPYGGGHSPVSPHHSYLYGGRYSAAPPLLHRFGYPYAPNGAF